MSFVKLSVVAAVTLSYLLATVSCQNGKDRVFNELDEYMKSDQYDDVESYLTEQRTWAQRIGKKSPANGELINKLASLEARISVNQYAIKRRLVDSLKMATMENYGQLFVTPGSEQLAESQAMLLVARGLLRGRATMLAANKRAWNQVYELAKRYEAEVKDDLYKEVALGLSRDRITLDKDLEIQQEVLEDLLSVKAHDMPELLIEKADIILDRSFKGKELKATAETKQVVPLVDELEVGSWVKQYASSALLKSIEEGEKLAVGNEINKSNKIDDIEKFRRAHLQKAGLVAEEDEEDF